MTAKGKAFELVQRFSKLDKGLNEEEWEDREVSFEEIHRKSALICVYEILKQPQVSDKQLNFLIEVKQEINKI